MIVKNYLICISLLSMQNTFAQDDIKTVQFIDHPNKNEYVLHQPGSDKHKYGYELKDNKHFHHTTTEDDGVRLGCYGYVLNGKKYSTQYVADIKGYRPVYTYDAISVYPKSGEVREASFIRNFNEDESRSSNIRYFFPEGCRGAIELSPDQNKMSPPIPISKKPDIEKKTNNFASSVTSFTLKNPVTEKSNFDNTLSTNPYQTPLSVIATPSPVLFDKQSSPHIASTYLPPAISIPGKYITKQQQTTTTTRPREPTTVQTSTSTISELGTSDCEIYGNCKSQIITIKNPEEKCSKCCIDIDSVPMITIPIKLQSAGAASETLSTCSNYAKFMIPANNISKEKINIMLTNPSELMNDLLNLLSQHL